MKIENDKGLFEYEAAMNLRLISDWIKNEKWN